MDTEAARTYFYQREQQKRDRRENERQQWLNRVREAILDVAPRHWEVQRVYLFGSITQSGRFRPNSDIDVAVECDAVEVESIFWRELEEALNRNVDVRPLTGAIQQAVENYGELVYERKNPHSHQ